MTITITITTITTITIITTLQSNAVGHPSSKWIY
jgi:hypothetical protein